MRTSNKEDTKSSFANPYPEPTCKFIHWFIQIIIYNSFFSKYSKVWIIESTVLFIRTNSSSKVLTESRKNGSISIATGLVLFHLELPLSPGKVGCNPLSFKPKFLTNIFLVISASLAPLVLFDECNTSVP